MSKILRGAGGTLSTGRYYGRSMRPSQSKKMRSMQDRGTLTMIRGCGTGRRRREREAALALPTVDELLDGGKR